MQFMLITSHNFRYVYRLSYSSSSSSSDDKFRFTYLSSALGKYLENFERIPIISPHSGIRIGSELFVFDSVFVQLFYANSDLHLHYFMNAFKRLKEHFFFLYFCSNVALINKFPIIVVRICFAGVRQKKKT